MQKIAVYYYYFDKGPLRFFYVGTSLGATKLKASKHLKIVNDLNPLYSNKISVFINKTIFSAGTSQTYSVTKKHLDGRWVNKQIGELATNTSNSK
jgi:hypothetical protein